MPQVVVNQVKRFENGMKMDENEVKPTETGANTGEIAARRRVPDIIHCVIEVSGLEGQQGRLWRMTVGRFRGPELHTPILGQKSAPTNHENVTEIIKKA